MRKILTDAVAVGNATVTLTGMAKGAGMIRPDMATMLAFFTTDATVAPPLLRRALVAALPLVGFAVGMLAISFYGLKLFLIGYSSVRGTTCA